MFHRGGINSDIGYWNGQERDIISVKRGSDTPWMADRNPRCSISLLNVGQRMCRKRVCLENFALTFNRFWPERPLAILSRVNDRDERQWRVRGFSQMMAIADRMRRKLERNASVLPVDAVLWLSDLLRSLLCCELCTSAFSIADCWKR